MTLETQYIEREKILIEFENLLFSFEYSMLDLVEMLAKSQKITEYEFRQMFIKNLPRTYDFFENSLEQLNFFSFHRKFKKEVTIPCSVYKVYKNNIRNKHDRIVFNNGDRESYDCTNLQSFIKTLKQIIK